MVSFDFYQSEYLGTLVPADDWYGYECRAADQLARYKRIYQVTLPKENAESMAICAMAEAFYSFDSLANGEAVQSSSIGSVSIGYKAVAGLDISPKAQALELYRCACLYLDIYRG